MENLFAVIKWNRVASNEEGEEQKTKKRAMGKETLLQSLVKRLGSNKRRGLLPVSCQDAIGADCNCLL